MCDDELKLLLFPAVEETEKEKEEEKKAIATFVSADPNDYEDEDEDEYEDEDEDLMYIEESEYHIICEGLSMANKYIQQITELLALQEQPLLSVNDFSELMQALQDLKHETLSTYDLACNYREVL